MQLNEAPSAVSRSQNEPVSTGVRAQLIQGGFSIFDHLFPLYDQMLQHVHFPRFIMAVVVVWTYMQVIISALWPQSYFWRNQDSKIFNAMDYLAEIFWFMTIKLNISPESSLNNLVNDNKNEGSEISYQNANYRSNFNNANDDYIQIAAIIMIVITVINYLILFMQFLFYHRDHRFIKWSLYVSYLIMHPVSMLLINPCAALTGASIHQLIANKDSKQWIYVIIGLIAFIGFQIMFQNTYSIICRSTILSVSLNSAFDRTPLQLLLVFNPLLIIIGYIFQSFPLWTNVIIMIIHIVLMVSLCIYIIKRLPFHTKINNGVFIAVTLSAAIIEIKKIIASFVQEPFIGMTQLAIVPVALVVCFIIAFIVVNLKYKKIQKMLTDPEEPRSSEDKYTYFMDIGLNKNETIPILFLRVGFVKICDYFIDWSLVKFITHFYTSNKTVCSVLQILSYFPTEIRQMNSLFSVVSCKMDLKFDDRFLIYQAYRLKTLRQSSSPLDANERMMKLMGMTEQCISDVCAFWRSTEIDTSYFEMLAREEHRVQSLWLEALRDYPNNSKFCEEYITFLIECTTDFKGAVLIKQRGENIDAGQSFSNDITFQNMILSFPDYFKNQIVDMKGEFRNRNKGNESETVSDSSVFDSSSFADFSSQPDTGNSEAEIDAELENKIARMLFSQSKLRIAFFHAVQGRSHFSLHLMPIISIITFIATLIAFIGFFFYLKITFYERSNSMSFLNDISETRFRNGLSSLALYFKYMNGANKSVDLYDYLKDYIEIDKSNGLFQYVPLNANMSLQTVEKSQEARKYFNDLLQVVSELANTHVPVYTVASQFLDNIVPLTICYDGEPLENVSNNLKNIFTFTFYSQQLLSNYFNYTGWYESSDYCHLITNWDNSIDSSKILFTSIADYQVVRGDELTDETNVISGVVTVLIFLLSFIPIITLTLIFIHNMDSVAEIIYNIDREAREQAMQPIRKDALSTPAVTEPKVGITKNIWISLAAFAFSVMSALLFFGMVFNANAISIQIGQLNQWESSSADRLTIVIECLYRTLQIITIQNITDCKFTDLTSEMEKVKESLAALNVANNVILKGADGVKPVTGYDAILDDLLIKESCSINTSLTTDFHDTYRCASTNQLISTFSDLVTSITTNSAQFKGEIRDYEPIHLIHIVNSHLASRLEQILHRILDLGTIQYNSLVKQSLIIMCFGIIASLILFSIGLFLRSFSKSTYEAVLALIKRIPPLHMCSNKRLKNLLLNRDDISTNTNLTISRNILHNTTDAMFCVGLSTVVEIVNPAITSTLGYTPEQILGQPVASFFALNDQEKVQNQLLMMKDGQSKYLYEDHLRCVSDNGLEVPCQTTILGMTREGGSKVESFVVILRNETELLKRQKESEEAKIQSEQLLFQILPRDIVIKLNRGEKDICFSVHSATIIFIDIVRFSDYAASLTPQEIMGNLSLIFAAFDRLIKKYSLITKIKLIGDIYMAAGGLFQEENIPQEHATQIVQFGLDAIQELDDINVKLNANLMIRIGVNTGGPLIAGVLGTDKPVFDIIGDPINVAARLQTTDLPGKIQIPESTFNLLSSMDFAVEPRGEVFLKGKGATKTFFVTSMSTLNNSIEIH